MCDEDAKGIRECGYLALVTKGEKIDVEKVKRALDDSLWPYPGSDQWWDKADADKVILSFYLKLTEDLLWKEIEECKETSAVALRALGDKYYGTNKDRIRKELADGFKTLSESQKAKAPAVSGFLKSLNWGHSSNSIESARKKLCVVALEIVAEHPVQADRLVFLEALGTGERLDFEQTVAAIRGLRIVGIAEDREKLVRFFSHISLVEAAATRAYLELSPDLVSGAKDLLKEVTTHRLRMIVLLMLRRPEKDVLWKLIEPLLLHDAEDIRRIAVFYACRVLTKKQLKAVLREYLGGPTYYYNVVTVLDRYLYAPRELQLHYQSEDTEFFEKIKPHPKWLVDE